MSEDRLDINTEDIVCTDTQKGTIDVKFATGSFNFSRIFIMAILYEFEELLRDNEQEIMRDYVMLIVRLTRLKMLGKTTHTLQLSSVQILQMVQWANNSITRLEQKKQHYKYSQRIRTASTKLMEWVADNEYNPFTF